MRIKFSRTTALTVAALLLPPWNVFWWVVNLPKAFKSVAKRESSKRQAALEVFMSPVTHPLCIMLKRSSNREEREFRRKMVRRMQAKSWLAERLREEGFQVDITRPTHYELCISTVVPARRSDAFGDVYAEAVHKFDDINVFQLCDGDTPVASLDRKWARKHGFKEWPAKEPVKESAHP